MPAAVAQRRIREIARITSDVIFGRHALQRMAQRGIDDVDVYRTLRYGHVDEEPQSARHDEWKCKITLNLRGGRTVGIVTIVLRNRKLFFKTIEWEDLP